MISQGLQLKGILDWYDYSLLTTILSLDNMVIF